MCNSWSFKIRMRIMIICSHARSLRNFRGSLIEELLSADLEVHVAAPGLTTDSATYEWLQEREVICHNVYLSRTGLNPSADLCTLFAMSRLMRYIRPEIVLSYTIKPVIYGTLAAWIARVPKRYALITGLGYAFSGEATGKRAFVLKVVRYLYTMAVYRSHHVFFQNPDDQALFQQLNILPESIPFTVVNGSGVDTSHFYHPPLPGAKTSFLLIARLIADKGVRLYAEAAKKLKKHYPEATFYLVGDLDANPESIKREELDEWVASGTIEYLGQLSDVRPALANAHVFVLPTYYREGVPRTILEALSMGRAVITTDAPGCRETVEEGGNGYLVPVKDVDALMHAMEHLITQPELIVSMGARSRAIAEEKYDVHKVNRVMLNAMEIPSNK